MKDEELRIRVAELVGWEESPAPPECPCFWTRGADARINWRYLPAYESDLNAMFEAEQKCLLTDDQWEAYRGYLLRDPTNFPSSRFAAQLSPTARQRAEAFVAVMQGDKEWAK